MFPSLRRCRVRDMIVSVRGIGINVSSVARNIEYHAIYHSYPP